MEIVRYRTIEYEQQIWRLKKRIFYRPRLNVIEFLSNFNELLDNHMPLRKLTQKEFKRKFKPWISKTILAKIGEKNNIFIKYINSRNVVRKTELFDQFKTIKNEITHLIRTGKKAYYQKYFAENKDNLQKIWKGIK